MHLMTPITPTRTNRITESVDQSIVKSTIISSCSSVKPISTNEKKKAGKNSDSTKCTLTASLIFFPPTNQMVPLSWSYQYIYNFPILEKMIIDMVKTKVA